MGHPSGSPSLDESNEWTTYTGIGGKPLRWWSDNRNHRLIQGHTVTHQSRCTCNKRPTITSRETKGTIRPKLGGDVTLSRRNHHKGPKTHPPFKHPTPGTQEIPQENIPVVKFSVRKHGLGNIHTSLPQTQKQKPKMDQQILHLKNLSKTTHTHKWIQIRWTLLLLLGW